MIPDFNKIKNENFEFLRKLEGNEKVGIDKQGRLYKVQPASKFTAFFQSIFSTLDARQERVAIDFAFAEFEKKEFIGSEQAFTAYLGLMGKMTSTGMVTDANRGKIAHLYHNARAEHLIAAGHSRLAVQAMVSIEKSLDPYLSKNIRKAFQPVATTGGAGGSYFIKDGKGNTLGVFKPQDEEYGMPHNSKKASEPYDAQNPKRLLRVGYVQGTGWQREIAASKLDKAQEAGVPFTTAITVPFPETPGSQKLIYKKGSLQQFAKGVPTIALKDSVILTIPAHEVHKIAAFDLATDNADRNLGNMLYDAASKTLTPIDQGFCFMDSSDWRDFQSSETLGDWFTWPQMKEPLSAKTKQWITEYPLKEKCETLKAAGMSEGSIRAHRTRMLFLKEGVRQGLTLHELATLSMATSTTRGQVLWLDKMILRTTTKLLQNEQYKDEALYLETFQTLISEELVKIKGANG